MKTVRYIGKADTRRVSAADFTAAGLVWSDLVWNKANGFEVNVGDDIAAFLLTQGSFELETEEVFGDLFPSSGRRLGGFVGVPGSQVDLTTVNEVKDIPGAVVTFDKGVRPIRLMVNVYGPQCTLTTRWPYIDVCDAANAVIFSRVVPIISANAGLPVEFNHEPTPQPAQGQHTWKLRFKHSPAATPGTATILANSLVQFVVYEA